MTVPTLINKTQNQEFVSKLKKAYSSLAQATNLIIANEGRFKNVESTETWEESNERFYNLYKKYLINAKDCDGTSGCFAKDVRYKFLGGSNDSVYDNYAEKYKRLVLADGVSVMFHGFNPLCNANGYEGSAAKQDVCGVILVDVNGAKKPNVIGRDAFWFLLRDGGLYPAGCYSNSEDCHSGTGRTGDTCACKVIREGAMNY